MRVIAVAGTAAPQALRSATHHIAALRQLRIRQHTDGWMHLSAGSA
jgi:hypothetical protein